MFLRKYISTQTVVMLGKILKVVFKISFYSNIKYLHLIR